MAAHYAARAYDEMAEVVAVLDEGDVEGATEAAAAEIRAALMLTRRSADSELSFALELRRRLPSVWRSLAVGEIDVRRARTIAWGVAHLPDSAAAGVVDRVIRQAPQLTTGQLAARIRRLAIEVDPDDAQSRYEVAGEQRRIVTRPAAPRICSASTCRLIAWRRPQGGSLTSATVSSERANPVPSTSCAPMCSSTC